MLIDAAILHELLLIVLSTVTNLRQIVLDEIECDIEDAGWFPEGYEVLVVALVSKGLIADRHDEKDEINENYEKLMVEYLSLLYIILCKNSKKN